MAMTRRDGIILALMVVVALLLGGWLRGRAPEGRDLSQSVALTELMTGRPSPEVRFGNGTTMVIVFTDYQCAACRKAEPALIAAARADGDMRISFREWPVFGPKSEAAARVALAADRLGLFAPVHQALMTGPVDEAGLRAAVEGAGGRWADVLALFEQHGPAIDAALAQNGRDALSVGARGTPTYLIGTRLIEGAMTERQFRAVIDREKAEKRQ